MSAKQELEMLGFYEDYLNQLEHLHNEMTKAIQELNQPGLDWSPGHDMNSIAVLAVHTAGAERFWVGDIIGKDPSHRNREAEFLVRGVDADGLVRQLADSLTYVRKVLEPLTLQDLDAYRTDPRNGKTVRVAWVLDHVMQHTGVHTGQMQLTRQLWDQSAR